jgi:hypothetical protein
MAGISYVFHCLQAEAMTLVVLAGICFGGTAAMPLVVAAPQSTVIASVDTAPHTTGFDLLAVLREFGPLVVLVLWFAWRDGDREKRMANRISELENFQREFLADRLKASIEALDKTSEAIKGLTTVIEGCKHRSTERP